MIAICKHGENHHQCRQCRPAVSWADIFGEPVFDAQKSDNRDAKKVDGKRAPVVR